MGSLTLLGCGPQRPSAFSPTDISGLSVYLLGDTGLLVEPQARQFTAANSESLTAASSSFFDVGDEDVTWFAWLRRDSTPSVSTWCSRFGASPNNGYGLDYVGGATNRYKANFSGSGTAIQGTVTADNLGAVGTGIWTFLIVDHDSVNDQISIQGNDNPPDVAAYSSGINDTGQTFHLSSGDFGSQFWDGQMAGAGMFKRILTSAEKTFLYNEGVGRTADEIAAHSTLGPDLDGVTGDVWSLSEYSGNAVSYSGLNDLTDNNTVTSALGPRYNKLIDESSNSNHGTLTGFTTSPAEMIRADTGHGVSGLNYALSFNNAVYVDCAGAEQLLEGSSTWSVSFKVKGSYAATSAGFSMGDGTSTLDAFIIYPLDTSGGNGVRVYFNAAERINLNDQSLDDGDYHEITWVSRSSTDHELYVDGASVATSSTSLSLDATLTDCQIGAWGGTQQFDNGNIVDVRLYDDPLTDNEVTYLATNGASGTDPTTTNLVGYWAGTDSSLPQGTPVSGEPVLKWEDQSGSGNHWQSVTQAKRPIVDAANKAVVPDGVDDLMDCINSIALTDMTVCVVLNVGTEITAASAPQMILSTQSPGAVDDGAAYLVTGSATGGLTNERLSLLTLGEAGPSVWGVGYNSANIATGSRLFTCQLSGTTESIRIDGAAVSVTEHTTGGMDSSDAGKRWDRFDRIMANATPGSFNAQGFQAVLIYDSALSAADIASVERYLSDYFSLGL